MAALDTAAATPNALPWWERFVAALNFTPAAPAAPAAPAVAETPRVPRPTRVRATTSSARADGVGGAGTGVGSTTETGVARKPLATPLPIGGMAAPGRQTADAGGHPIGAILPPDDPASSWRMHQLDDEKLRHLSPSKLLAVLSEASPDVSRALYVFLRMSNAGWTITAKKPADAGAPEKTGETDHAAQAALRALLARLSILHGNVDVLFNRLFLTAWMRGAFFAELVFDANYAVVDLVAPDPITVRFRRERDPERGLVWRLGQMQSAETGWLSGASTGSGSAASTTASTATAAGKLLDKLPGATSSPGWPPGSGGGFVPLDYPTICYVPVDPFPGSPYGRALCTPAVFSSLFLLQLLHDLRRVVSQQGYPRLDVELVMEQLRLTMPPDDQDDPDAVRTWVSGSIKQVQDAMGSLKPEDTYVHTDVVKVNRPVGTVDSSSLGGIDAILKAVERMSTRALKAMPLSMGSVEGISEANATRQWELEVAGIKSFQHLCEGMLERLFGLALQMAGLPAVVEVRFAELRAAELLRDAQVETLRVKNAREKYNAGWITQDEASMDVTGHPAAEPEPRTAAINGDLAAQDSDNEAEQDAMASLDTNDGEPKEEEAG